MYNEWIIREERRMEVQNWSYDLEEWAARAAESYQELARVFSSYITRREGMEYRESEQIAGYVMEKLCKTCPKRALCLSDGGEQRSEAFWYALFSMEKEGSAKLENFPEFFRKDCSYGEKIPEEMNLAMFMERMKRATFNQMMEGKEALVQQLEETAHFFQQVQSTMNKEEYLSEEQKRDMIGWLKKYHIRVKEIETRHRLGKGRELRMKVRCDSGKRKISVPMLERLLAERLGFPVKEYGQWKRYLSEEEKIFVFQEIPSYCVTTGVAHSAKQAGEVSGDSFSFFYEEEGEMAMILSDGMGSGEEAAKESEGILRLLERMLSAGFKEETAIRLINSVLALRAEQKMFATLDISRINLYSGTCEFIKIGGAATFIRRGKWMECVEAKTLPIGMVQKVDYDFLVKKLYAGDCIIMMSDGVLDMIPPEERIEFLQNVIGEEEEQSPQVMAGRILNASLLVQNFEPKDDMTVLVCRVSQKKRYSSSVSNEYNKKQQYNYHSV